MITNQLTNEHDLMNSILVSNTICITFIDEKISEFYNFVLF